MTTLLGCGAHTTRCLANAVGASRCGGKHRGRETPTGKPGQCLDDAPMAVTLPTTAVGQVGERGHALTPPRKSTHH